MRIVGRPRSTKMHFALIYQPFFAVQNLWTSFLKKNVKNPCAVFWFAYCLRPCSLESESECDSQALRKRNFFEKTLALRFAPSILLKRSLRNRRFWEMQKTKVRLPSVDVSSCRWATRAAKKSQKRLLTAAAVPINLTANLTEVWEAELVR